MAPAAVSVSAIATAPAMAASASVPASPSIQSATGTVSSSSSSAGVFSSHSHSPPHPQMHMKPLPLSGHIFAARLRSSPMLLLHTLLLDVSTASRSSLAQPLLTARRVPSLLRLRADATASLAHSSSLLSMSFEPTCPVSAAAALDTNSGSLGSNSNSVETRTGSFGTQTAASPGNGFALVEKMPAPAEFSLVHQPTLDSDSSLDYVNLFASVIAEGADFHPELHLRLDELAPDAHFTKCFLNPMAGSTPTQILVIDDSGSATGFAAGLSMYLAANVKAPNDPNLVYYLEGGINLLRSLLPNLFEPSQAAAVAHSLSSKPAFLGWGDEAEESNDDTHHAAVAAAAEKINFDSDEVSSAMDDADAIGAQSDESLDAIEIITPGMLASFEEPSDVTIKSIPSSTTVSATSASSRDIERSGAQLHVSHKRLHNYHRLGTHHPRVYFPHIAHTTSPTHDLRELQQHLIAAVWYGERHPCGDRAVPIAAGGSGVDSEKGTEGAFLHLGSCYVASDSRELRARKIRHVLRLGWGFDGTFGRRLSTSWSDDEAHGVSDTEASSDDDGYWSAWDEVAQTSADSAGSPGSSSSAGMNGVEGSVKFFQRLAGVVGTPSELGMLLERIGTCADEAVREADRRKMRKLMGGVGRRIYGWDKRRNKRDDGWRIKVYDFPIEDTPAAPIRWILEKCCEVIEAARLLGENVLVHCHAGVSRSSTIVLAYLMRFQRLTLYEAWLATYKARPIIRPNEGFARALQELEREIHPHLRTPTLPIFWMCDSYGNFMEVLEVRERLRVARAAETTPCTGAAGYDQHVLQHGLKEWKAAAAVAGGEFGAAMAMSL